MFKGGVFLVEIFFAVLQLSLADNKVLLISMDGFRWDYIDNTDTPNFDKFISEGVRVTKVKNVYSTITFPNHWTMVTGKYEEDHGIVANRMYDGVYDEKFSYGRDTKWFNESEPIWITTVREGKKSGTYMWVGNQAKYEGAETTKIRPFINGDYDHQFGMDVIIDWLATDDVDFAAFYMNEPDHTGHSYGPLSTQVLEKVREIDGMLGHLMERIKKRDLDGKLNVIIASDHGMAAVSENRTINIREIIDFRDVEWYYISIVGHILPKENATERVYNLLKNASDAEDSHFRVYYKEDVPAEYHYSKHRRIQPIVLVADNGWAMTTSNRKFTLQGNHGFNNSWDDMQSMMVARGPNIVQNYTQPTMNIINLYPMLCDLLNLETCYKNPDARKEDYSAIIKKTTNRPTTTVSTTTSSGNTLPLSTALICVFGVIYVLA